MSTGFSSWVSHQPQQVQEGLLRARDASARLAQQGWTTPLWLVPRQSWQLLGSGDPADVDANFVQFYAPDGEYLERIISSLLHASQLTTWRSLLEQVVSAYRRQEYTICVPALLTVLEGVLMSDAGDSTRVIDRIGQRLEALDVDPDQVQGWLWRAVESFIQQVFKKASFTGERPGVINRHWILHGRDASSWGQSDCLRLMQAIETICDLDSRLPV